MPRHAPAKQTVPFLPSPSCPPLPVCPASLARLPDHPETRTNILVGDAKDEFTGCPEYKVSAVRLEKVVTGIEESFALPGVTIEGERVPVDHRELALAKA